MKGLTVLLGVLATIMLVIYAVGDPVSQQYLKQSMYLGNTIFVEDGNTATVNGENVEVVHRGFTNMDRYEVAGIVQTSVEGTNNTTVDKTYLILSHEIGGIFGKSTPVLAGKNQTTIALMENATLYGADITYVGDITTKEGELQHIYDVNGVKVIVGLTTYSFVQTDDLGNGIVLKQDTNGNVNVGNVSKPFNLGNQDYAKLIMLIAVSGLIGYWALYYGRRKGKNVYGRLE